MTALAALIFAFSLAAAPEASKAPAVVYETFGRIQVDGQIYDRDVVIEKGKVRARKKGPSRSERAKYGHTPLTPHEAIPWDCKTLIIGTGMHGRLPVVDALREEAKRRGVKLIVLETKEAVKYFHKHYGKGVNAIFHTTC